MTRGARSSKIVPAYPIDVAQSTSDPTSQPTDNGGGSLATPAMAGHAPCGKVVIATRVRSISRVNPSPDPPAWDRWLSRLSNSCPRASSITVLSIAAVAGLGAMEVMAAPPFQLAPLRPLPGRASGPLPAISAFPPRPVALRSAVMEPAPVPKDSPPSAPPAPAPTTAPTAPKVGGDAAGSELIKHPYSSLNYPHYNLKHPQSR